MVTLAIMLVFWLTLIFPNLSWTLFYLNVITGIFIYTLNIKTCHPFALFTRPLDTLLQTTAQSKPKDKDSSQPPSRSRSKTWQTYQCKKDDTTKAFEDSPLEESQQTNKDHDQGVSNETIQVEDSFSSSPDSDSFSMPPLEEATEVSVTIPREITQAEKMVSTIDNVYNNTDITKEYEVEP